MPHLYRLFNGRSSAVGRSDSVVVRYSKLQQAAFILFFASLVYIDGTLPCGRFYYEGAEGFFGNSFLRLSYQYLYLYLGVIAHMLDLAERWYLGLLSQVRALTRQHRIA